MKKTVFAVLLSLVLTLTLFVNPAFAAEIKNVETVLPEIKAEVSVPAGTKIDADSVKADLDGSPLTVAVADSASESTQWVIMVDTSKSLSSSHFEAEKKAIVSLIKSKGENDIITLWTFDETSKQILDGTESANDAEKKVNAIKANGEDTAFYSAVSKTVELAADSKCDNCVAVIFTDGVETLKKSEKNSAVKSLEGSDVPVYGIYPNVEAKSDATALNDLLAKSKGKAVSFEADNAAEVLTSLNTNANGDTVVLNLTATEDIAENEKAVLTIDLGDGNKITKEMAVNSWTAVYAETEFQGETAAEGETDSTQAGTTEEDAGFDIMPIVAIVAVAVIAIAVVVLLKKKKGGTKDTEPVAEAEAEETTVEEPAEEEEKEATDESGEETEEENLTEEEKAIRAKRAKALEATRKKAAARAETVAAAAAEAKEDAAKKAKEEAEAAKKAKEEAKIRAKEERQAKKKIKEEGSQFQFYFVDKK